MESINKRILFIIHELGYNRTSFSKALGNPDHVEIQGIVGTRGSKPNPDLLSKIMRKFPEINADWLLTGVGKPLKIDPNKVNVISFREKYHTELASKYFWNPNEDKENSELKKNYEALEEKIEILEKYLSEKEKVIVTMQRLIDMLDNKQNEQNKKEE